MTNEELDRRIQACAVDVEILVGDLCAEDPNVEHAIPLGALLAVHSVLVMLGTKEKAGDQTA